MVLWGRHKKSPEMVRRGRVELCATLRPENISPLSYTARQRNGT
jgi:hypothetical protein